MALPTQPPRPPSLKKRFRAAAPVSEHPRPPCLHAPHHLHSTLGTRAPLVNAAHPSCPLPPQARRGARSRTVRAPDPAPSRPPRTSRVTLPRATPLQRTGHLHARPPRTGNLRARPPSSMPGHTRPRPPSRLRTIPAAATPQAAAASPPSRRPSLGPPDPRRPAPEPRPRAHRKLTLQLARSTEAPARVMPRCHLP